MQFIKQNSMERVRTLGKIDSTILAAHILYAYGPMSHLKLQKLLYLIEGYHLAYFDGASLIDDEFQAWVHGPVSRKIFDQLKDKSVLYGDLGYTLSEGEQEPHKMMEMELSTEQLELISEVMDMYKGDSGLTLEGITHNQTPWIKARVGYSMGEKCENVISKEDMRAYFSQLVG